MKRQIITIILVLVFASITLAQDSKWSLEANIGIGVGNIRSDLSPHFDAVLFFQKAGEKQENEEQIGLWLRSNYSYLSSEGTDENLLNSFLSVFLNFKQQSANSNYRNGVGFGYLIKREGDIFSKNTYVISYYISAVGRGIMVIPELILNDGFKEPIPSIQFSVLF